MAPYVAAHAFLKQSRGAADVPERLATPPYRSQAGRAAAAASAGRKPDSAVHTC